ncbi:MAG: glutathione S-transferase N-terminal domain-containing protein [Pseudomonadota bacterium]
MIDLYYYRSPNGRKVLIALEELGLPYRVEWVDIAAGDQHSEAFRQISPGGKIPAIVDHDAEGARLALFESGAILIYLAEKAGALLPMAGRRRMDVLAWVAWQVSNQGPMLGQAAYFHSHAPASGIDVPHARERYVGEARKCYEVLNLQLLGNDWVAGDFSIADIALFPWTRVAKGHGVDLAEYPNVKRWSDAVAARPSAKVKPAVEAARGAGAGRAYTGDAARALFGSPSDRKDG